MDDAAFYAYAAPEPAGFAAAPVRPAHAHYHRELREFVLPYAAVAADAEPERRLLEFLEATYEAGAALGAWDRAALEREAPASARAHREHGGAPLH